jgi:GT2 family glycosyltransferase
MSVGIVIIGRNEGDRLRRCLASVISHSAKVIYVDSGSTDGSVPTARAMGVEAVELATDVPFTAARARNAGFQRLAALDTQAEFVQFVDGDCEIAPDWMEKAADALRAQPGLGVVFGRRRERFPNASVYNRLCDMEWDTPIGQATECGGDAMFRAAAFREVGGYKPDLIAGEEPELCVRLRNAGWKIERLDAEMTLHDAAMTRFSQWWKRNVRNGHAFAQGAALHGKTPARHWVKQARSNWLWGAILPLIAVSLAWPTRGISLVLFALYLVLYTRVRQSALHRGRVGHDASLYSAFCVIGKFPHAQGQLRYLLNALMGRRNTLIEYKASDIPDALPASN